MSDAELDRASALFSAGKTPGEVHALLQRARAARGQPGPDLTTARRALRGTARKRARVETRGRLSLPGPKADSARFHVREAKGKVTWQALRSRGG